MYNMINTDLLREHLLKYLGHPHTHMVFADAVKDFPEKFINEKPAGLPYSFWQLLEHMRITQLDMIDFIQTADYKILEWPRDYWPRDDEKADAAMFNESIRKYLNDVETLRKIIGNTETDLFAKIPHGSGQTILKEVLQIIDHESYHMGQFIVMRRLIGEWK